MWIGKIEEYILYEDKEVLVCHKPAGMAVQNSRVGAMDMESALKNYLAGKDCGKLPYLGIIHRLDQPVEGVVVFAKTSRAAGELSRQISSGEMGKIYLAVTSQRPVSKAGELVDHLKKDGRSNTSFVTTVNDPGGKEARLRYEMLEEATYGDKCKYLVRIKLDTGRHHQIRVQMAHAGMPLLGDRKYNPQDKGEVALGLCSSCLTFCHPATKKKMTFETVPQGAAFQGFEMIKE
ncbi:MAG: RluA family pseudouridine synthase [Eubacteriales bacterium]|nr:RluA family pseudouridine synthase [Eubacteriales bacterium]